MKNLKIHKEKWYVFLFCAGNLSVLGNICTIYGAFVVLCLRFKFREMLFSQRKIEK